MSIFGTLKFITSHPLNSRHKVSALSRFVKWQIGSRILPGPAVISFVNDSKLVVSPGMTGATMNIYTGLHEFPEMAAVLHVLRPEDTFVDVGANVGSFTVLAGAAVGCSCISMEPIPGTFENLKTNIRINGMERRSRNENVAVGSARGVLRFTKHLDTMNHVVSSKEELPDEDVIKVPVLTLDEILGNASPTMIKIDVEGYEKEVIAGAAMTLQNPQLLAVIMEINDCVERYGHQGSVLYNAMLDYGFLPFRYLPQQRSLLPSSTQSGNNVMFVRNPELFLERVKSAP